MNTNNLLQTMRRTVREALLCAGLGFVSAYLPVPAVAQAIYSTPYTFTTLARQAPEGSAGDPTQKARFSGFRGLAVDAAGNVYVASLRNQTICRMTPAGDVTILAGRPGCIGSADGRGSEARFYYPQSVALDAAGDLYVADSGNDTIRRVTPSGVVTTLAGLAKQVGSVDGKGSAARFNYPRGLAVDSAGNVYVADLFNANIRKVTPAGVVTTLAGQTLIYGSADGKGDTAQFNAPMAVAVDAADDIYVADYFNNAIRKVTATGVVTTLAGQLTYKTGSADGTGRAAQFCHPCGLVVDSAGNVYVADTENHTIRRITSDGAVTTLAGMAGLSGCSDGTGNMARFACPMGVALDPAGNLYVADVGNAAIRKGVPLFSGGAPLFTSARR